MVVRTRPERVKPKTEPFADSYPNWLKGKLNPEPNKAEPNRLRTVLTVRFRLERERERETEKTLID